MIFESETYVSRKNDARQFMSQTVTEKVNPGRANNFDFLRLVLAILVIFSHSYPLLRGDNTTEPFIRLSGGQLTGGGLAVAGFFILSGYLITKSWFQSARLGDYLRRRVLRIYPGFLATAAFCALVVGPVAADRPLDYWRDFSPWQFTKMALTLKGVAVPPVFGTIPLHAVNGSLWTIRIEFVCYIGVAALGLAGALRRPALVFLAFLGCISLYGLLLHHGFQIRGDQYAWFDARLGLLLSLISCFLAGMLFYLYRDRITYSASLFAASVLGLAVLAALPGLKCLPLAIPVLGGYTFFYLGFLPVRRLQGFARRGDLSYGTYLYAFPIQQLTLFYLGTGLHPLALFLIATPLTAILATMSWTFVEKPFMRLKAPKPTLFLTHAPIVASPVAEIATLNGAASLTRHATLEV